MAQILYIARKIFIICALSPFYLICDLWEFKYRKVVTNKHIWRMFWCLNVDDEPFSPGERTRIFQPKFWKKIIDIVPCFNFRMHFLFKGIRIASFISFKPWCNLYNVFSWHLIIWSDYVVSLDLNLTWIKYWEERRKK